MESKRVFFRGSYGSLLPSDHFLRVTGRDSTGPFPGRFDGPRNSRRRQRLWRRDSTLTEGWKRFVLFVQAKCNFKDKSLFIFFSQVPCNTVLLFRIGNTVLCRFMFFLRHLSIFEPTSRAVLF